MFDDLRQAVNRTHGSLHHAFLAWDKTGSGELSKAKLRVGLRACRGALEKDVQAFTEALGDLDDGKITFNRLYQCFHEGERRFPSGNEKTSPNRKTSLPVFFDHSPAHSSHGIVSRLLAEEEEKLSNEIKSIKIPQPQKQEIYRSPLQHNVAASSPYKTPPRSPSPLSRTASPSSPSSANVSRRLDFSARAMDRTEDTQSETSSQNRSVTSPRAISPSSARFQKMREAKILSPSNPTLGIASSLSHASPRPLEYIASSVFARSAAAIGRPPPRPFQSSAAYDLSERRLSMTERANSVQSSSLSRSQPAYRSSQPLYGLSPKLNHSRADHEVSSATSSAGEWFDRYSPVKASSGICRSPWLLSPTVSASAEWSLSNRRLVEDEMDVSRDGVESLLNDSVRMELRTTLLTLASETPSLPMEATIAPSELRRTLHFVDPSLSRHEVKILTRHLLGGYSPQRVKISRVLEALEHL